MNNQALYTLFSRLKQNAGSFFKKAAHPARLTSSPLLMIGVVIAALGMTYAISRSFAGHGGNCSFVAAPSDGTIIGEELFAISCDSYDGQNFHPSQYDITQGGKVVASGAFTVESEVPVPVVPQCSDGIDNDGDGKIDHGTANADPGCDDFQDHSELDAPPDSGGGSDIYDPGASAPSPNIFSQLFLSKVSAEGHANEFRGQTLTRPLAGLGLSAAAGAFTITIRNDGGSVFTHTWTGTNAPAAPVSIVSGPANGTPIGEESFVFTGGNVSSNGKYNYRITDPDGKQIASGTCTTTLTGPLSGIINAGGILLTLSVTDDDSNSAKFEWTPKKKSNEEICREDAEAEIERHKRITKDECMRYWFDRMGGPIITGSENFAKAEYFCYLFMNGPGARYKTYIESMERWYACICSGGGSQCGTEPFFNRLNELDIEYDRVYKGGGVDTTLEPSTETTQTPPTDTTPPITTVTSLTTGSTVSGIVNVAASANDDLGVTKVDFYLDGVLISSDTDGSDGYSFGWNTLGASEGTHILQTIAYDAAGNPGTSTEITFQVNNPDITPPTAPTNLTTTTASATKINLAWTASTDNVGVAKYQIQRGGIVIATVSAPATSYSDITATASTTHTYNVLAVDAANNTSVPSNAANVTTPPAPDTTPPTAPSLTANAVSPNQINLSWSPSTDSGGSGLKGYKIFRNNVQIAIVPASTISTSYGDTNLTPSTSYVYQVKAYDGATPTANDSPVSNTVEIKTLPIPVQPQTITLTPTDDAYVDKSRPTSNYGQTTQLKSDVKPTQESLLKFNLDNVGTKRVVSAKLRLYVASGSASPGTKFFPLTNNNWTQSTVNWNNKPAANTGRTLASLGPVTTGTWIEVDVTTQITGNGSYGFLINNSSADDVIYGSKESTAKPQLIIGLE